ncbi:class I SAM-dependent methyltransferase [Cytophaga sp. FL35]|uniref:class I SAM-dependent methyltransferase n=1 Tax=Cytophaga sp. FL35 TaxID=1904456 RepID=UPI001653C9B2|nr:class I SAM-dependent methyltransferase [Cytophaga sp. FL35]MBC6998545.1 methyltransferase domain-containing protein [Cytophaga sp. FL35]
MTNHKKLISKNVEDFYNQASEETRLENGMGIFEFERVKELIKKHLHKPNMVILDVGGGTGKYSEWLSDLGHKVYLVEPVMKHIKLAQKRAKKSKNGFSVKVGASQQLDYPNKFADIILLHGPLYHLQNPKDRAQTISESMRVLKSGGTVLGFAINYTASTLVGLLHGYIHDKNFFNMCKEELTSSNHFPPKQFPGLMGEAYYHRPEELKREFQQAGFTHNLLTAVEGMTWLDKDYFSSMLHPKNKKTLSELLSITENDENLLAFSPHMMIASKKPN